METITMKKIYSLIVLAAFFVISTSAYADHAVTVTWTHSVGPGLFEEDCMMDGEVMKTVGAEDAPTCTFNVVELDEQKIDIISRNTQGGQSVFNVGILFKAPAPATNGHITTSSFTP